MSFFSVRERIGQLKQLRFRPLQHALCLLLVLSAGQAAAGWQDPLQTPAIQSSKAHSDLMLDVTRAGTRLVAVGAHGNIVFSDDDGRNWKQAQVPVSVTLTAVDFPTSQDGWAVGHDGVVLYSTDAGVTWTKQFDGYAANKAIVEAAEENKVDAELSLEEAIKSQDQNAISEAELLLENITYALDDAVYDQEAGSTKPFLDVWFYDNKLGFIVGAYGMVFKTTNGGQTWNDWSASLKNPDRLHINSINKIGARSLISVGEQGMILRSDDLGSTWRTLPSPYEGSLFGAFADGENVIVFGLRGNLFRSIDGGSDWQALANVNQQALMAATRMQNRQVILVGNAGSKITLDNQLNNPKAVTVKGRTAYASAVEAADGALIVAGEKGVQVLGGAGE